MKKPLLQLMVLVAVICGGFVVYLANHRRIPTSQPPQKRIMLANAKEILQQWIKQLVPNVDGNDDLNRQYLAYKRERYDAGIVKIDSAVDQKNKCWLPLAATVGKFEGGSWFFEISWLDSDSLVEGIEFRNDADVVQKIQWHKPDDVAQRSYDSSAIHYELFDLQDHGRSVKLIKDAIWPNRGTIAAPLSFFSDHPRWALIDANGRASEWVPIYYVKPTIQTGQPAAAPRQ